MRAVRPLLLFTLLVGFAAAAQTDDEVAVVGEPTNYLGWAKGSPAPTIGGVEITVDQKADPQYVCSKIVIRVIDTQTGMTLDTHEVNNPANTVTKTYSNYGSNRQIRVTVDATFEGVAGVDTKSVQQLVTTQ